MCMVKCFRCGSECKIVNVIKGLNPDFPAPDYVELVWECPNCGKSRFTRRKGKMFRYHRDEEYREAERKRKREYMREKRSGK